MAPGGFTSCWSRMNRARRERLTAEDREVWAAYARGEIKVSAVPAPPTQSRSRVRAHGKDIDLKLDLHGLTQAEAHRRLARAFERHDLRRLLIVTGLGRGKREGGVLKKALPRWLAEPAFAPRVLSLRAARPEQGGEGAVLVELRRTRPVRNRDR
ncbi:MAG: Smr/MutS family protein [Alphaproteobacteria bacterium]|nr:Smr/MutS family protein [Alphaproteobacteria bacterium]